MLLTIPWIASVYAGRVDINNGACQYKRPHNIKKSDFKKLDGKHNIFTQTGVQPDHKAMKTGAKVINKLILYMLIILK